MKSDKLIDGNKNKSLKIYAFIFLCALSFFAVMSARGSKMCFPNDEPYSSFYFSGCIKHIFSDIFIFGEKSKIPSSPYGPTP